MVEFALRSSIKLWICILIASHSALALAENCAPYLKKNSDGISIGVKRIESLKGRNAQLYDVSDSVKARRLPGDKRINIFRLPDVFNDERVFMGFGRPNVFLAFPPGLNGSTDWTKFDAKSFKRADSKIVPTRGLVQSGVLLVFKDLRPEKAAQILAAAQKYEGTRQMTCVNANCRVLTDSGVTLGGESLDDYYFPGRLLRDALRFGLELDGKPLEFDVVRVHPDFLEGVGLGIDRAVGTTFCRHAERACEAKSTAGRHTLLTFAKSAGRRVMGVFIGAPSQAGERRVLEKAVVRMAPDLGIQGEYQIRVSQPSTMGTLLRLIWGPHTLFELPLDRAEVDLVLPEVLRPFPEINPGWVTKLKKNVLFSKPVVRFLRAHLAASYEEFDRFSSGDLFGMFRTDSADLPNRYNIVVLGDRVIVMKTSIQLKLVDWVLSKHLMVSSYAADERFAGEVWKTEDGKIHLNRNSGTFRPSLEQLQSAAMILKGRFPNADLVIDDAL